MRLAVLFVFVVLIFANQMTAQDMAKIEVVKFNWNLYFPPEEIDNFVQAGTENVNQTQPPARISVGRTNRRTGERTPEERSRDFSVLEETAVNSASLPASKKFLYELKIKNTETKTIKSFVWEYQPVNDAASKNNPNRNFLCTEKIKAGDSETLKIFSQLPPTNVVDTSAPKSKSGKNHASDILINRIEYTDGTLWQRADWDSAKYKLDSQQIKERLKNNTCTVL